MRETLEREVPGVAASALFEALGRWGSRVPASFAEVVDLAHGPLRACLAARLGDERAAACVRALDKALRLAEMPTGQLAPVARAFDRETTKSLARVEGALVIAVITSGLAVPERIAAVLDPARVIIDAIRTPEELARMRAHLALVDATDPIDCDPAQVASALTSAPLVLVWGTEECAAVTLSRELERAKVPVMTFARAESEALIDVLRSRAGEGHFPPPWR